jgi:hypothetical protein
MKMLTPDSPSAQSSREAASPHPAGDPLAEAEAVRELLMQAQARLSRLLATVKLHRRQARAVRAAVHSLRQLPPLVP